VSAPGLLRAAEAALLVGGIGLDQVAVAQVLLSQPLVGGAILGWALGDAGAGLLAGSFFQFLCLTDLPVGASVPPDTVLAGLVCSAAFLLLPRTPGWSEQAVLGLLAALFLPLASLGRALDVRVRRGNRVLVNLTESLVGLGHLRLAQAAALGGIVPFFLRGALLAAVVLLPAAAWGGEVLARSAAAAAPFAILAGAAPLLGLASLVVQRRRPGWQKALAAGIGAGLVAARVLA
jgi:mannose/fructose/N-acetylgalactosamine-specific phosphotransferase system component IIC